LRKPRKTSQTKTNKPVQVKKDRQPITPLKVKEADEIPAGLLVISWGKKLGAYLEASFPAKLNVPPGFITQIFSAHFQGDLNTYTPRVAFQASGRKVVSYLVDQGGVKKCFALLLHKEEKSSDWFDTLRKIALEFMKARNPKKLPSIYKKYVLKGGG